jgi:prepilin-type N-terminal cleavage/methylation domain-containing protein
MNHPLQSPKSGFTLMETVIAIGVLALLLTGFIAVFAPAAEGIRKSINVQEADRLASTLEKELVTLRVGQGSGTITNGFNKAFDWIAKSNSAAEALFVYQYRGNPSSLRADGTAEPMPGASGTPGEDHIVQPMARRKSDPLFMEDLNALEGNIFVVKCTQLVFNGGQLENSNNPGAIVDPKNPAGPIANADAYPEAVIAFSAQFFSLPSRSPAYINGAQFTNRFPQLKNPVFTRNLAVRR